MSVTRFRTVVRCAYGLALVVALLTPVALADLPVFMQKPSSEHIRIMCYNVNWDSIFENGDPDNHPWRAYDMSDEFVRVVTAINPDIVCLQEINSDRDPQDVADILDAALPLGGGETWRAHSGSDNVIAARFDLSMLATDTIPTTNRGQAMAPVDLPDGTYAYDLYLMNAHFKAGSGSDNINRRQQHADAIIHWTGDAQTSGGYINLPAGTPIVVLGDLNVYDTDPAYQLTTLITGDVVDEGTYGSDWPPDWDVSDDTDALPLHNGVGPDFWTWRDDSGSYNPGATDRIIYSDSVIAVDNSFVLNTKTMSPADLAAAGLQANDVVLQPAIGYYDHLPMVVDLLAAGSPPAYTLTVNITGNGSVTKNPDQATYSYNDIVQLTANADPGWTFDHWEGDLTGSTNPDNITMTDNMTVTAVFAEDCNDNGVDDAEDLASCAGSAWCDDCNGNGILDWCDIDEGTSTDLNGTGIPDECESLGDMNCDGSLNNFDIDAFVLALTSAGHTPPFDNYYAVYPACDGMLADINGDGTVNNFDIDPFVELLS